ncbi:MAG: PEP-CTERM sorting domain-containing protein [Edaphobacter sp.]
MRKAFLPLALFSSSLILSHSTFADTMDDFVLTGDGNTITFSLPASPPGNMMTCPPNAPSCLPGSETAFSVSTMVTLNNAQTTETIEFPTNRFGGGLQILFPEDPLDLFGAQLFTPDAANPTFLTDGPFLLSQTTQGNPPFVSYSLTITPEAASTPEPSTMALVATGLVSLVGFAALRLRKKSPLHAT